VLDGGRVVLAERPIDSIYRPSGDRLLESLAPLAAGAAGVVLTGMGSDGAEGIAALREAGAATFAQDETTSSVYGMPKRAAERGAQRVLPLDGIAPALTRLAA
jgi:chemotaxis response regulator CheB